MHFQLLITFLPILPVWATLVLQLMPSSVTDSQKPFTLSILYTDSPNDYSPHYLYTYVELESNEPRTYICTKSPPNEHIRVEKCGQTAVLAPQFIIPDHGVRTVYGYSQLQDEFMRSLSTRHTTAAWELLPPGVNEEVKFLIDYNGNQVLNIVPYRSGRGAVQQPQICWNNLLEVYLIYFDTPDTVTRCRPVRVSLELPTNRFNLPRGYLPDAGYLPQIGFLPEAQQPFYLSFVPDHSTETRYLVYVKYINDAFLICVKTTLNLNIPDQPQALDPATVPIQFIAINSSSQLGRLSFRVFTTIGIAFMKRIIYSTDYNMFMLDYGYHDGGAVFVNSGVPNGMIEVGYETDPRPPHVDNITIYMCKITEFDAWVISFKELEFAESCGPGKLSRNPIRPD